MDIIRAYGNALLSEASYANFQNKIDPEDVKTALETIPDGGFSQVQAEDFVTHWKVANHQPDTASGFSATLFESLDEPGRYTLAIRGTQGAIDVAEDIFGIAAQGVAARQAVDLYRYYRRLTTPAGEAVDYSQGELLLLAGLTSGNYSPLTGTTNYLSIQARTADDRGLGVLPTGGTLEVTGHSLGGHLAMLFTRMFPAAVDQVTTFNGAGLGGIAVEILDLAGFAVDVPDERVNNVVADGGLDLTAGAGYVIGSSERVFIEESINPFDNHRIARLSDALAVQGLLAGLDRTLTASALRPLMESASHRAGETLERVVDAVGELFGVGGEVAIDERDGLYRRLQAIEGSEAYQAMAGTLSLVAVDRLADAARADSVDGLAYRYALERLNPFALTGDAALYAIHNASGVLDAGRFTASYLEDRAHLLSQLIRRNRADSVLVTGGVFPNEVYEDLELGIRAATSDVAAGTVGRPDGAVQYVFGSDSGESISGGRLADRLYGGGGGDSLAGGDGDDYLEGGAGDDVLRGGRGNDTLVGGVGNDTYRIEPGDGLDTVIDSDGQGSLVYAGITLAGGSATAAGADSYLDDNGIRYTLRGSTLLITTGDGQLQVRDFSDGMLGIRLQAAQGVEAPLLAITGTNGDDRWNSGSQLSELLGGGVTGTEASLVEGLDGDDDIRGSSADDRLLGGAGEDYITAGWGDDEVLGGSGRDVIQGNAGDDRLYGGADSDWLSGEAGNDVVDGGDGDDLLVGNGGADVLDGGAGNDVLHGDSHIHKRRWSAGDSSFELWTDPRGWVTVPEYDGIYLDSVALAYLDQAFPYDLGPGDDDAGDLLSGGSGDDVLAGDAGDDLLYGGADQDLLLGGPGNDYLEGGAGADNLEGDARSGPLAELASNLAGRDTLAGGAGDDRLLGGFGDDRLSGGAGDDLLIGDWGVGNETAHDGDDRLYGGAGNDELQGGRGRDALGGGEGDDRLFGEDGSDAMWGGAGADRLSGGAGDDELDGGAGDDVLDGGAGADRLQGGAGNDLIRADAEDRVIFRKGDGEDVLVADDGGGRIEFEGVDPAELVLEQLDAAAGGQILSLRYGSDRLLIEGGYLAADRRYVFAGRTLDQAGLMKLSPAVQLDGSDGADIIHGSEGDDRLDGLAGADALFGGGGDDRLSGGEGDDRLDGGEGRDTLDGGSGNDVLAGGEGNDRYLLSWGMGMDTIVESDGGSNTLVQGAGLTRGDLAVWREGADLRLQIRGSGDGLRIRDYAAGEVSWQLETASGRLALDDLVGAAPATADLAGALDRFRAGARAAYFEPLLEQGYRMDADGVLRLVKTFVDGTSVTSYRNEARFSESSSRSDEAVIERSSPDYQSNFSLLSEDSIRTAEYDRSPGAVWANAGTSGTFVPAGSVSGLGVPAGGLVVEVFGGGNASAGGSLSADAPADPGAERQSLGYWVYDSTVGELPGVQYQQTSYRQYLLQRELTLEEIHGGPGDNIITTSGYSIVDAGAGDDVLLGGSNGWYRQGGVFLDGNEGDDTLLGSDKEDVLTGGAGFDYVDGRDGADTYLVLAEGRGVDLIADSATMPLYQEGAEVIEYRTPYLEWYYRSIGLPDWYERLGTGNLPSLPPDMARNDYAALEPLYQAGVIDQDTVEFGKGITLADLRLDWGRVVPRDALKDAFRSFWREGDSVHTTLDITLADGHGVRVVVPHTLDPIAPLEAEYPQGIPDDVYLREVSRDLGLGIEQFRFADGTVLSMQDMIALAPPAPGFDPQLGVPGEEITGSNAYDTLVGSAGDDVIDGLGGNDSISGGEGNDVIIGGRGRDTLDGGPGDDRFVIDGSDSAFDSFIGGDGVDRILGGSGDDVVRLRSFDAGNSIEIIDGGPGDNRIAGTRGYDTIDLSATIVRNIDRIDGGAGNDILTGTPNDDRIIGGPGRDLLNGGAGDDTFLIEGTDTAFDTFNGGEGRDRILGGAGDDTIRLRGFGVGNSIEIIDGGPGDNRIAGTRGYDTIDLSATIVRNIDRIDGGAGNDILIGTPNDDRMIGGPGRDLLNGGAGDDTFLIEGTDTAFDTFNGGEGRDRILGGAGD
ncbi:MAG TPA: hypothetical protein ENK05_13485, partial [Gammaproteobacteria bacterium]|nr:hypothetical protein [Gammaproteobacteria bacterium]